MMYDNMISCKTSRLGPVFAAVLKENVQENIKLAIVFYLPYI